MEFSVNINLLRYAPDRHEFQAFIDCDAESGNGYLALSAWVSVLGNCLCNLILIDSDVIDLPQFAENFGASNCLIKLLAFNSESGDL